MSHFLPKSVRSLIEEFSRLPGVGPKSAQRLAMHLLRSPKGRVDSLGDAVLNLKENIVFCQICWNIAEENPCKLCGDEARDQSVICVVEEILDVVAFEKTGEFNGVYHVLHGSLSPIDGVGPDQLKIAALVERVKKGEKSDEGRDERGPQDDWDERGGREGLGLQGSLDERGGRNVLGVREDQDVRAADRDSKSLPGQTFLSGGKAFPKISEIVLATNPSLEGEATALYIQKQLQGIDVKITRIARGLPVGGDVEYADEVTLGRALKGRAEF